jgi:hypothetical protein
MEKIIINIYSIVGDSLCVSSEDGDKIFEHIKKVLDMNKKVELSFKNVEILTSAFLNNAIGKLYENFENEKLKNSMSVIDISSEDKALLQRVIDTAKLYYSDKKRFEKSIDDILGK